jgi:UDP-N-acetyl-D-mannosaminuronic acid dehydrogenase
MSKKICVVGLGYIGLPTSALLANNGYEVYGVDIDKNAVDTINQGKIHIVEPDLDKYVKNAVESKNLIASTTPNYADVFIIAVPTPFHAGFIPNIDYVIDATKAIAPFIKDNNLIILESTSPIGTTEKIAEVLKGEHINIDNIHIAHCPERVLPGHIMRELVENDRIVGGITKQATTLAADFYREFVKGSVLETTAKTAEMAKLTENSFRDSNIAFANELSVLCDTFDIDVWELIELANKHPRVNILQPGCGVGGHCIAVDPWFIVHAGGSDAKMIRTAREVNTYKTKWVIEKIKNKALEFERDNNKKPKLACMGLAFKPDIDDLRESPALQITQALINDGLDILAVEPNIKKHKSFEVVDYNQAIETADIVVFLVKHKEFIDVKVDNYLDFCGVNI